MYLYLRKMPRSKLAIELHKETIREREKLLCKERAVARRFNGPLKVFVQRKYGKIYEEYCELFQRMLSESPTRRDLSKTIVFKQFLLDNPDINIKYNDSEYNNPESNQKDGNPEGKQKYNNPENNTRIEPTQNPAVLYVPRLELEPVVPLESNEEPIPPIVPPSEEKVIEEPNILVQALADIIDVEPVLLDSVEYNNRVETVHSILEEMKNQFELKNILNEAGVDLMEGEEIEMNYFDEFEKDIQPFNHN